MDQPTATTGPELAAEPARISGAQLYLLAIASAVVTANAYYIHPIVALVAEDFGVGKGQIGIVPALNQLALAVGIFFFLPLGDRIGNARLAAIFTAAQFAAVALMAFAGNFELFVAGSTLLGLFTITPYLIPAYASKRVDPARIGHAVAVLTTGVIGGILLARVGAGMIGEYLGWRTVYEVAAVLMLAFSAILPMVMRQPAVAGPAERGSYGALLLSTLTLAARHRTVLLSGSIQGLNFAIFLSVWLGIGLHLPAIGYGVDTVGWLAAVAIVNLASTPRLGAWTDRFGATRARAVMAALQMVGVLLLFVAGGSVWVLLAPLVVMNVVGPVIDVAGRATFLGEEPAIRTRLMTVYIMLMFCGGGFGSWAGTTAYAAAGWMGTCGLALGLSVCVLGLSTMTRGLAR